jgi:hypothetical protein
MNKYKFSFELECPNNSQRIAYQAEITVDRVIMVENIASFFLSYTAAYHEEIADASYETFGGYQVITAHHHGVDVETTRGRK